MTQQLNNQLFAFTKQFTDSAFKAQSLALKGLETVAELQLTTETIRRFRLGYVEAFGAPPSVECEGRPIAIIEKSGRFKLPPGIYAGLVRARQDGQVRSVGLTATANEASEDRKLAYDETTEISEDGPYFETVPAVRAELGLPTYYLGRGEKPEDLKRFAAAEFVEAFFAD